MTHNHSMEEREAGTVPASARMVTQYRTVDTRTVAGIRQAERLHTSGWRTVSVGLFRVQFVRHVARRAWPTPRPDGRLRRHGKGKACPVLLFP